MIRAKRKQNRKHQKTTTKITTTTVHANSKYASQFIIVRHEWMDSWLVVCCFFISFCFLSTKKKFVVFLFICIVDANGMHDIRIEKYNGHGHT